MEHAHPATSSEQYDSGKHTHLAAEQLNNSCFCSSLDQAALRQALSTELGSDEILQLVERRCPYLFRNLALLGSAAALEGLGVAREVREILLANIPFTELVGHANAERLWSDRRSWFFKPVAGYGGRAAYRGDKLTKRVWQEILAGDYIAQHVVAPGQRVSGTASNREHLKFDLRAYVYDGRVQWTAARVYQGQTTNFRTPGGGFAPVYRLDESTVRTEMDAIGKHANRAACCAS